MLNERENLSLLKPTDYNISGNDFRAFFDSDNKLVFVVDNTVDDRLPNVLLVMHSVSNRKWDDVLENDYLVDLETVRPKKDNKYQKLDIEYNGLEIYADLIDKFNNGQDLSAVLTTLSNYRDAAAHHSAEDRLRTSYIILEKSRDTIVKSSETVSQLSERLKELRIKLSTQKKAIGKEPTKQSAAKILRTESLIDATNAKVQRAQKRISNAEKRLIAAESDAASARAVLERKGVLENSLAETNSNIVYNEIANLTYDDTARAEHIPNLAGLVSASLDENLNDAHTEILNITEPKAEVMADENIKKTDEEIKPLFDTNPNFLDSNIAFQPIDFNSGATESLSQNSRNTDVENMDAEQDTMDNADSAPLSEHVLENPWQNITAVSEGALSSDVSDVSWDDDNSKEDAVVAAEPSSFAPPASAGFVPMEPIDVRPVATDAQSDVFENSSFEDNFDGKTDSFEPLQKGVDNNSESVHSAPPVLESLTPFNMPDMPAVSVNQNDAMLDDFGASEISASNSGIPDFDGATTLPSESADFSSNYASGAPVAPVSAPDSNAVPAPASELIRPVSPISGEVAASNSASSPLPVPSAGTVAAAGAYKPTFLYYIMLFVLIALSIFTLWFYQQKSSDNTPSLTKPVVADVSKSAAANDKKSIDKDLSQTSKDDEKAPEKNKVQEPIATPVEVAAQPVPVSVKPSVVVDVVEPDPVPVPVVVEVVEPEPVPVPVVSETAPSPFLSEPNEVPDVAINPIVQEVVANTVNVAPVKPLKAVPAPEPVVNKPAYNAGAQNDNMFVAAPDYLTDAPVVSAVPDYDIVPVAVPVSAPTPVVAVKAVPEIATSVQVGQQGAAMINQDDAAICEGGAPADINGCCAGEIFTDMENGTFACCIIDGTECYPPLF